MDSVLEPISLLGSFLWSNKALRNVSKMDHTMLLLSQGTDSNHQIINSGPAKIDSNDVYNTIGYKYAHVHLWR